MFKLNVYYKFDVAFNKYVKISAFENFELYLEEYKLLNIEYERETLIILQKQQNIFFNFCFI